MGLCVFVTLARLNLGRHIVVHRRCLRSRRLRHTPTRMRYIVHSDTGTDQNRSLRHTQNFFHFDGITCMYNTEPPMFGGTQHYLQSDEKVLLFTRQCGDISQVWWVSG